MAKAADKKEQEVEVRTFTPSEIAEQTGADPKAIRAFLRANYTRPLEMKNKSWVVTEEMADALLAHFSPEEEDVEEDEVVEA
jgi:hypothetical protein